ncbi:MAG TPA: NAD(P)-dependent oxidoreductase [Jiangellaceae bacterium]
MVGTESCRCLRHGLGTLLTTDKTRSAAKVRAERVLVTGAAGFIGSALCRALVQSGAEVHATSRSRRTSDDPVSWWQVDLSRPEAVAGVLRRVKPGIVFHLASHVSGNRALEAVLATVRDNLLATINVLTAACEMDKPRVIMAGSMEECDIGEANAVPVSPYAAAKTAASTYARMFHGLYALPVVNLRIFMVYGPGQHDTAKLVPYVTTSLLRGEPPRLSSGRREIDWIFVDDVVAAFLAAAQAPRADGQTVDVGSGELITVRSIVERIAELVGGSTRPVFGALNDRPVEHRRVADVARSAEIIGWRPRTIVADGLVQTVQWFRARYEAEKR